MLVSLWSYTKLKSQNKTLLRLVGVLVLSFSLEACKTQELVPLDKALVGVYNYGTVDARFCLSKPSPADQKLKYLFIIDHSASNKPGITLDPSDVQNTDPDGGRRYGPLVNFVNNLVPDANTTLAYSIIDFDDDANQPTGLNGFENDKTTFINIAKQDWIGTGTASAPSPNSSGFTNYHDALSLAQSIIKKDAQNESVLQSSPIISVSYRIIFVSDGVPTVQASSGSTLYTQQFTADIEPVIKQILDLKNDPILGPFITNISLNTAYYFNTVQSPNSAAITLLQQIADAGNGLFLQFASGQQILYQQFAPPSRNVQNQLAEVFVENENVIWWDDGRLMLDTDSDGLPDLIEQQLGSNSSLVDSDGNGVSDSVEYRTKGKACNSTTCDSAERDPYAICSGFNPTTDNSGAVTFSITSNDGLNDCEKFLLRANSETFNSNGDLIPDFLAFKNNISIQTGNSNIAFSDPFGEGITNYSKLKLGLPIQVSSKELKDFVFRSTNLTKDTSTTETNCYHLVVNNVALSSPNNKIKVYVIQNSSTILNKPFLMTAENILDSQLTVSFQAGDFK